MSNFRQAPKLYHNGTKGEGTFYMLPQSLMDCVFNELNGKQGNQIKLMSVLLGTLGDGTFGVSEKWICARTGMDQPNYSRARKALVEKGWLKLEGGCLHVDFETILKTNKKDVSPHVPRISSEQNLCDNRMPEPCTDDMHNKEKQINNKKERDNHLAVAPKKELGVTEKTEIPEHILDKLQGIGIDFQQNSVTALEKIIGGKLDFFILNNLIDQYRVDFAKAKGKPESYIFGVLKKIVQKEYKREKNRRDAEKFEHERNQYGNLSSDTLDFLDADTLDFLKAADDIIERSGGNWDIEDLLDLVIETEDDDVV